MAAGGVRPSHLSGAHAKICFLRHDFISQLITSAGKHLKARDVPAHMNTSTYLPIFAETETTLIASDIGIQVTNTCVKYYLLRANSLMMTMEVHVWLKLKIMMNDCGGRVVCYAL